MKKIHKVLLILLLVTLVVFGATLGMLAKIEADLKPLLAMEFADIPFSQLKDGQYSASYAAFPVEAEVKVNINNQTITHIELIRHVTGKGQGAEVLVQKVLESQSLKLDSVSGATYSSKVILKAIEMALTKATR